MIWQPTAGDKFMAALQLCVRTPLVIAAAALAVLGSYTIVKFSWYFRGFLDRTIFAKPW